MNEVLRLKYFGLGRFERCPLRDYEYYPDRFFDFEARAWVDEVKDADMRPVGFYRRLTGGEFLFLCVRDDKVFLHHFFGGGLTSFELHPGAGCEVNHLRNWFGLSSALRISVPGIECFEVHEFINPFARVIVDPLLSDRLDFPSFISWHMRNRWSGFKGLVSGWK